MDTRAIHRGRGTSRRSTVDEDDGGDVFADAPVGLVRVRRGRVRLNAEAMRLLELHEDSVPSFEMWLDAFFGGAAREARALLEAERRAGFPREHETDVETTAGNKRIAWRVRENPTRGADFPAASLESANLTWALRVVEPGAHVPAATSEVAREAAPIGNTRRDRTRKGRGARHLAATARLHALRSRCPDEEALLAGATEVMVQAWEARAACVVSFGTGREVLACTRRHGGCEAALCRAASVAGLESGRGPSGPSSVGRAMVMTAASGEPSVSLSLELADGERMLLTIDGPYADRPDAERMVTLRAEVEEIEEVGRVLVDVIDAERTVRRLREREAELSSMFAALPDTVTVVDGDGRIASFHNGHGLSPRRVHPLVGRPLSALVPESIAQRAIEAGRVAMATLEVQEIAYSIAGRHYVGRGMAFGEPARVLWLTREITDERKMRDELVAVQRFEGLAALAGALSHDFSNLLTSVIGNVELARADASMPAATEALDEALDAARRASDLCRQIGAMSGKGHSNLDFLNVTELVEEMLVVVRTTMGGKVEIVRELLDRTLVPTIIGDPSRIRQVILGLLGQARDALGERSGRIEVRTGVEGDAVFIAVSDDGRDRALGPETKQRLFSPTLTTRLDQRELALAALLEVAQAHGGRLVLDRDAQGRNVVKVLLPIDAEAAGPESGGPTPRGS